MSTLLKTTNIIDPSAESFEVEGVTIPRWFLRGDGEEFIVIECYASGDNDGRYYTVLECEGRRVSGHSLDLRIVGDSFTVGDDYSAWPELL
jgi:hypothetical protein